MENDAFKRDELNSPLTVMKTYLKAKYRLSELLRAQRNDRLASRLKLLIENGAPDKKDMEEAIYQILRQYRMYKFGRLYLNQDEIIACKMRAEDKVLHKHKDLKKACEKRVTVCLSSQQVKDPNITIPIAVYRVVRVQ